MVTLAARISHTALDLMDVQLAFFTSMVHATMDAGVNATELNVDAMKSQLACSTVATRQWLCAGIAAGTALAQPCLPPN
jgi:hypothetical protein